MNVKSFEDNHRLEEWALLIEEQRQSGLNIKEWCKQNNITTRRFYHWQKKLLLSLLPAAMKKQPSLVAQRPHFTSCDSEGTVLFAEVPTHLHAVASSHNRPPVICVKCPKCDVVIEPGMDRATIQAVLNALEVIC